jgi:hypothetical protein
VKKSVPANNAKWVRMKAAHVVVRLRSGAGGRAYPQSERGERLTGTLREFGKLIIRFRHRPCSKMHLAWEWAAADRGICISGPSVDRVAIAGITVHLDELWMKQTARNVTMEGCGILRDCRYLLHDRDTKYTRSFRAIITSGQVEPLTPPARCPNLNAYAERWVPVKEECLCKVILLGERSLRRALNEFVEHYHAERTIIRGRAMSCCSLVIRISATSHSLFQCRERLGGLLRYFTIKRRRDRMPKCSISEP